MNNFKPTPGPWRITRRNRFNPHIYEIESSDEHSVCRTACWLDSDPLLESASNARLIAAAPALLERLEELVDLCPRMSDDDPIAPAIAESIREACAVIKATKESEK